jgi:hypothetical protein
MATAQIDQTETDRQRGAKGQFTGLQDEITTRRRPWTYALRCVAHKCPIGPNIKVNETKKPQSKA